MAKDDAIGPNGRTVRCTNCSATWFVPAETEPASTPDEMQLADMTRQETDAPIKPSASAQFDETAPFTAESQKGADAIIRDRAEAEKRRARRRIIWLIWLIPLMMILAFLAVLFFGRNTIVERFPTTAPIYNAIGVKVSQSGLEVESPTLRLAVVNGETTVVINGVIRNISNKVQSLPMLRLSLHNPSGEEVANWLVDMEKPVLRPRERIEFASEYPNPPPDSTSLRYRLM